jgi:hypothetical protein
VALTVAPDFPDGILTPAKLQQLTDAINERTPLMGRKTSDQNVGPSNTTLQDVTEMLVAVEANAVYEFTLSLQYSSNSTADIKIGWTVPSGAAMDYGFMAFSTAGTWIVGRATHSSTAGFDGANNYAVLFGVIVVSSTSGSVQFQAAQNTSTAVTTNVEAGSYLMAHRVS